MDSTVIYKLTTLKSISLALTPRLTQVKCQMTLQIDTPYVLKLNISNTNLNTFKLIVVQSLSCVWLLATPWTAAHQASLTFTIPQSLLKLMFIELVMPSNHLILCGPLLLLPSIFPSIRDFSNETSVFSHQVAKILVSASASVLPMNIQGWLPLGVTGLISLLFKRLSIVLSSTTVWKHQLFSAQPSLHSNSYYAHDYWKSQSFEYMDLCWQNDVSV